MQAFTRSRQQPQGFTLMELMVVMSLILILMVSVSPVYTAFTQNSRVDTGKNQLDALVARARTFAIRYQREVLMVIYWRGNDFNSNGRIDPGERFDDSQTCTLLILNADGTKFLPLPELTKPDSTDPLFKGNVEAPVLVSRLPRGLTVAKSREGFTADLPPFLDFVMIRFRTDGTTSNVPPIVNAQRMSNFTNFQQWLAQESQLDEIAINLEAPSAWNRTNETLASTQRGLFMDIPPDAQGEYKLPTSYIILFDGQALRSAGINESATSGPELNNLRQWVAVNGVGGKVNDFSGRLTFSGGRR